MFTSWPCDLSAGNKVFHLNLKHFLSIFSSLVHQTTHSSFNNASNPVKNFAYDMTHKYDTVSVCFHNIVIIVNMMMMMIIAWNCNGLFKTSKVLTLDSHSQGCVQTTSINWSSHRMKQLIMGSFGENVLSHKTKTLQNYTEPPWNHPEPLQNHPKINQDHREPPRNHLQSTWTRIIQNQWGLPRIKQDYTRTIQNHQNHPKTNQDQPLNIQNHLETTLNPPKINLDHPNFPELPRTRTTAARATCGPPGCSLNTPGLQFLSQVSLTRPQNSLCCTSQLFRDTFKNTMAAWQSGT